jgi:hypothetical protein
MHVYGCETFVLAPNSRYTQVARAVDVQIVLVPQKLRVSEKNDTYRHRTQTDLIGQK